MAQRVSAPRARPRKKPDELTAEEATKLVTSAKRTFERTNTAFNDAIHGRAEATHRAHYEGGLSWQRIADLLDLSKPTTMALAGRYEQAKAEGRTMRIGPAPEE